VSDFDFFGDFEPERPATLEEDKPEPPKPSRPKKPPKKRKPAPPGLYNAITTGAILGTIAVVVVVVLLIQNPTLPFNPFPPIRPQPTPTLFVLDSGSVEPGVMTPLPASQRTLPAPPPGFDLTSTAELPPSPTGLVPIPGSTLELTILPFSLQNNAITYTKNTNEDACNWLSIAGQVLDIFGNPLPGLPIEVTGDGFDQIVFTGTAEKFGPSGYEVNLNNKPIEAEFLVQLRGTTGQPLSETVVVKTLDSCEQNVAIANFIQTRELAP
jgi:hypothetical protein